MATKLSNKEIDKLWKEYSKYLEKGPVKQGYEVGKGMFLTQKCLKRMMD